MSGTAMFNCAFEILRKQAELLRGSTPPTLVRLCGPFTQHPQPFPLTSWRALLPKWLSPWLCHNLQGMAHSWLVSSAYVQVSRSFTSAWKGGIVEGSTLYQLLRFRTGKELSPNSPNALRKLGKPVKHEGPLLNS